MSPVLPGALAAFAAALTYFSLLGLPLARGFRLGAAAGLAPALGWAVFAGLALPVWLLTGFTPLTIGGLAAVLLLAAWLGGRRTSTGATLPAWFPLVCLAVAWLPGLAVLPHGPAAAVRLSEPIFDHVKIALTDAVRREGLPVPNPFWGAPGRGRLGYYYLWHVVAGALARLTGVSGWSAEAGMTAFTAYASLMLVGALAVRAGAGARGLLAAPVILLAGGIRPIVTAFAGPDAGGALPGVADLLGWLNQAAWVPQHLMSACCGILSVLLLERLAAGAGAGAALLLGVVAAAGFGCSIWVGGVAFAVAGSGAALLLLWRSRRAQMPGWCALAACIAAALASPVAADAWAMMRARDLGGGVTLAVYPWLAHAGPFARALGLPLFLAAMFPALLAALGAWRWDALTVFAALCLAVTAVLRSTIMNNDLGWRAVLPALLVAASLAAAAVSQRRRWALVALLGVALGLPDTLRMARDYAVGEAPADVGGFAAQARIWAAVRAVTGPEARIGSNPLALRDMTPWPVNIGWALLSNRSSCYAGWASVVAYGGMRMAALDATKEAFKRVFAGVAQPGDMALVLAQGCDTWLVTARDGAWQQDAFAAAGCRLAAHGEDWRLYRCAANVKA